MAIDNLAQANSEIEKLWKRLERLERAAPLGFSSISRGSLRITSPEGLIVEGSARVSGVLNVSGTENVTGALGVTGTTTLAGPLIVNGTATITGPNTSITGPLHVTGDQDNTGKLDIKGTATVKSGGKIVVEGPSAATLQDGELSFATGGKLVAYPSGISAKAGTAEVIASVAGAFLFFGTNKVSVTSGGTYVSGSWEVSGATHARGALYNEGIALKAGAVNNVHIDAAGRIWRTS